jgi:hypothetical protein
LEAGVDLNRVPAQIVSNRCYRMDGIFTSLPVFYSFAIIDIIQFDREADPAPVLLGAKPAGRFKSGIPRF